MKTITHAVGGGKTAEITTTQHSAYGDLLRFGSLYAWRGNAQRGTRHGFGAQTLAALVEAGLAEWQTDRKTGIATYPRTIVPVGNNEKIHAEQERRERVRAASLYVTSRFFPPLPAEYGELAVLALEEYAEYGEDGAVRLPEGLDPMPRRTYLDATGIPAVKALDLIYALRIDHMIEDFES